MRIDTKAGSLIPIILSKDPELREFPSGSKVLKLSGRYTLAKNPETGKHGSDFIDIDIWDNVDNLDGMFQKGDALIVVGDEIKTREYNGKTYTSMRASGVHPSCDVVFRWLQDVINVLSSDPFPAAGPVVETPPQVPPASDPEQLAPSEQMYAGEQLSDYTPPQANTMTDDEAFIESDKDDLPF